jgi:hypothetical protein
MSWIVLADGHETSLDFTSPDDYQPERIAHSLANINRYNGHALRPYSVAEHSLLVLDIAERILGLDVFGQIAALTHDYHESVTGDQATPTKAKIGPGWRTFEAHHAHLVALRFRCHTAMLANHAAIRKADLIALATEREQLLPKLQPNGKPCTPWPVLAGVEPLTHIDLMDKGRQTMTWQDWRDQLLGHHQALEFCRAERSHFDKVESF